jgi:hypothetical protein
MRALRAASGAIALVLAACAAGCFNDRGLAIEVDTSQLTGAKQVELFIGMNKCPGANGDIDCTAITAQAQPRIAGTIWYRDADATTSADTVKLAGSHLASFRLEVAKETADTALPLVAIVATDMNHTAVGLAVLDNSSVVVPANGSKIVHVALSPASTMSGTASDQAFIWTSDTSKPGSSLTSTCLVFKHGTDTNFIVPENDMDCDGVPTGDTTECDPDVYAATELTQVACVAEDTTTMTCRVGGKVCVDGTGNDPRQCVMPTVPICVPIGFCTCPGGDILDCIKTHTEQTTHIMCKVDSDGKPHDAPAACTGTDPAPIESVPAGECNDEIAIAALGTLDASNQFDRNAFGPTANFGNATMAVSPGTTPCSFQVQWTQGAPPSSMEAHGFVRFRNDKHKLIVPIDFNFDNAQGSCEMSCNLVGDKDPMFTLCTAPPTATP